MPCTAQPGRGRRSFRSRERLGLGALIAGRVEEGPRQVILEPVGVRFAGEELELSSLTLWLSMRYSETSVFKAQSASSRLAVQPDGGASALQAFARLTVRA